MKHKKPRDLVNHPAHYVGTDPTYEHVRVMEAWGMVSNAFLYNATKYLCRASVAEKAADLAKPGSNRLTDLRKAEWYLKREIARVEAEQADGPAKKAP